MNKYCLLIWGCYAILSPQISFCAADAPNDKISLSLNLRYYDPADPSEGGSWMLVAKTNSFLGIAGIVAKLNNIDNGPGQITIRGDIGAMDGVGSPPGPAIIANGTLTQIVYGQDISHTAGNSATVGGIGKSAPSAARLLVDPLRNPDWANATIIALGTFGALRPTFETVGGGSTDGTTFTAYDGPGGQTEVVAAATSSMTTWVRGDSVQFDGLKPGDANRDGVVDSSDLGILRANYGSAHATWDQGNFDGSPGIDGQDFLLWQRNFGAITPPQGTFAGAPQPTNSGGASGTCAPAFADFNEDCMVDGTDFLIWQLNYPVLDGTALADTGDANGDGDIDSDDLAIWKVEFGVTPGQTTTSLAASVPEPSGLMWALFAAFAAKCRGPVSPKAWGAIT